MKSPHSHCTNFLLENPHVRRDKKIAITKIHTLCTQGFLERRKYYFGQKQCYHKRFSQILCLLEVSLQHEPGSLQYWKHSWFYWSLIPMCWLKSVLLRKGFSHSCGHRASLQHVSTDVKHHTSICQTLPPFFHFRDSFWHSYIWSRWILFSSDSFL